MAKITLKGNPVHTNADLPAISSMAKDFVLVDKDLNDISLKDFAGTKKILSIVPSLDTSVCSASAKHFNSFAKDLSNVVVLVISADLPFAQKRFCESEKIANIHTLSMMRSKDFAKDYGLLIENGPLKGICARAIVILDESNQVLYTELVPEITKEPDYDKITEFLKN